MGRGLTVGSVFFKSQKSLKIYVRSILDRYPVGTQLEPIDFLFCQDLLRRHPESVEKIGCGLKSIRVEIHSPWTTKGFTLTRIDGTAEDFSFNTCLSGLGLSSRQLFNKAARHAIFDQIKTLKRSLVSDGSILCSVSGEWLPYCDIEMDHYPEPLADLIDRYLSVRSLDLSSIQFFNDGPLCRFQDESIAADFVSWHKDHASLRPLEKGINQALGRHSPPPIAQSAPSPTD